MVKIAIFQCLKGNNSENMQPRITVFLCSTHCLILFNICVKFHENISNSVQVTERTRFFDRQTTDANGKNNMSPLLEET